MPEAALQRGAAGARAAARRDRRVPRVAAGRRCPSGRPRERRCDAGARAASAMPVSARGSTRMRRRRAASRSCSSTTGRRTCSRSRRSSSRSARRSIARTPATRRCASCCSHDFAVILLDVQMPGMNGFETARADQVARAHALHPDHLPHGDQQGRGVRLRGVLGRRGGLPVQAVPAGHPAVEGRASSSTCTCKQKQLAEQQELLRASERRELELQHTLELHGVGGALRRDRRARRWTRSSPSTPTDASRCSTRRRSGCSGCGATRRSDTTCASSFPSRCARTSLDRVCRRIGRRRTSGAPTEPSEHILSLTGLARQRRASSRSRPRLSCLDARGKRTYTLIVRDISERKRAEEALAGAGRVARARR